MKIIIFLRAHLTSRQQYELAMNKNYGTINSKRRMNSRIMLSDLGLRVL